MSLEDFKSIVKQWKKYSDYIYLHVLGEPLMHPELSMLLDLCDSLDMKVTITTNGSLLKDKYEELKGHKCLRQINISVHNFKEQNIDMESYVANCLDVGSELAKEEVYINYRFWNMKQGCIDDQTREVLRLFENRFDVAFEYKKQKIGEYQFVHFDEVFEWPSLSLPHLGEQGRCLGTRSQLAVLVDGSVVPCCLDANKEIPLGNLHDGSLDSILESERYLEMKKGFENNKVVEELCKHCSFKSRFDK